MADRKTPKLFYPLLFLWIIQSSFGVEIVLLEPGFLDASALDDLLSFNSQSSSIQFHFDLPSNQSARRGCGSYYGNDAAPILGDYFFNNFTLIGQERTFIFALECDNLASIAASFGQGFNLPVIASVYAPHYEPSNLHHFHLRSLFLEPFFQAVEQFLLAGGFYNLLAICAEEEEDALLSSVCESSVTAFSKEILVKRMYLLNQDKFVEMIREVDLTSRVIILVLSTEWQDHFLIHSSTSKLWDGSYVILCTSFYDTLDLSFIAPHVGEDEAASVLPTPVFVVRSVIQDNLSDAASQFQLDFINYTDQLHQQSKRIQNLNGTEWRELFNLHQFMVLMDAGQNNGNIKKSTCGTEKQCNPFFQKVVLDKIMPDGTIEHYAIYDPNSPLVYTKLFDESLFGVWWPNIPFPPPDLPACLQCREPEKDDASVLAVLVIPIVLILIPPLYFYLQYRKAKASKNSSKKDKSKSSDQMMFNEWNIKQEELTSNNRAVTQSRSMNSIGGNSMTQSETHHHKSRIKEAMRYKQIVVWVSQRDLTYHFVPDQSQLSYFMKVKQLNHANLATLYGLVLPTDPLNTELGLVMEFFSKRSLFDLIAEEENKFNDALTTVLIRDIVTAMTFMHQSFLFCHGSLKSPNCMISSRFNVKITDHYLRSIPIRPPSLETDESLYQKMLWTAPEILRGPIVRLRKGTREGDVYSFGIILQEILMKSEPFRLNGAEYENSMSAKEIVRAVIEPSVEHFRPKISPNHYPPELIYLMKQCWAENPLERPTFELIGQSVANIRGFNKADSYLDYVLKRMETYNEQLEARVHEATSGLVEEKRRSDELLAQMMPKSVIEEIQKGNTVLPESFEYVTLAFTGIIGFASIAYDSTPLQIVLFLNGLYSMFDHAIENYDVYKVETIQDSYFIASGLPVRNGTEHVNQISVVALNMLKDISKVTFDHIKNLKVEMKIGIHTGMCAAGVIGLKAPRYCIFGDTVNTTSRMCSTSEAQKIQISENTKAFMTTHYPGVFLMKSRGTIEVKGKGQMNTYWLEGRT